MNRSKILVKKLISHFFQFAIVLIGITLLTFSILHLSPRNPAELWIAGSDGNVGIISKEAIEKQEKIMGLDKPFIVQYGIWLENVIHGDLGISYTTKRPVLTELLSHMMPTVIMTGISLIITVMISIPVGIYCAVNKDKTADNIFRVFSFMGISIPSFVMSLFLLWCFSIKLKWMPVIAQNNMAGLILPITVLVFQCTAKMTRQIRAIILDELDKPYVEGAIMRGVKKNTILFSHVLKNSAAPIMTCISIYTGIFLGGSTVIEGIFSVNGLGRLAVSSVARLDYTMIQGFVLWCALIYLMVNLLVDVLSAMIDPRIKYNRI